MKKAIKRRVYGMGWRSYTVYLACLVWLAGWPAWAAPMLVTPQLSPGFPAVPYRANLLVTSATPLASVTLTGLPAGLTAVHNGSGSVAISGTTAVTGTFPLTLTATDTAQSQLATTVTLTVAPGVVTAVASGITHTCVVANGGVQCFGSNADGQLGNGTGTASNVPVEAIPDGSSATAVAGRDWHSCAVVAGGVKCWGRNDRGQLGDGTETSRLAPVQVIPAGSNATAVAVGALHSCALVAGGVQCWGSNGYGQLGDSNIFPRAPTPAQVIPAGSDVTALEAGRFHTCAIMSGGLRCWGDGQYGQLGYGGVSPLGFPYTVIIPSGVTAVAAGEFHTCAVRDGGVLCWGNGAELRGNSGGFNFGRTPEVTLGPEFAVTALAASGNHTCAVSGGGLVCWGNNALGQFSYTCADLG